VARLRRTSLQTAEEKKAYQRIYKARWRKENPQEHRDQQAKYREDHPDRDRNKSLKWAKNNPDKKRAKDQRYRTRKTGAGGSFTVEEFKTLCRKYGNRCLCCRKHKKLTADHVIPVSRGGTSNISNIQPLCQPCNSSKKDGTLDFRKTPTHKETQHE